MKKTLFILASVALLVFAFAAVAGAEYAGAFLNGGQAAAPGYLSWAGATDIMASQSTPPDASISGTAHGGYVTTTTKCAVCHSVHRATGFGTAAGVVNNQFLTAGVNSCVQCHCAWGASPVTMLVEWAAPEDGAAGPHDVDATLGTNGCATCHRAGVHGGGTSNYWGMNAFMLGGSNDAMIKQEIPWQNPSYINTGTAVYTDGTGLNTYWFVNGSSVQTSLGGVPGGDTSTTTGIGVGQWAAQRSLLTGWTCSQTGCHVNSVLGNTNWGQTYSRDQLNTTGTPVAANMMLTTGHSTVLGTGMHDGTDCGPCHPGNWSGGYRYYGNNAATVPGGAYTNKYNLLPATNYALSNSKAYGCDQCHDAVGVATNSTAFPHGNQAIDIYQWQYAGAAYNGTSTNTGDPTDVVTADGTNLWMYQSNMSAWNSTSFTALVDPSYTLLNNLIDGTGSAPSGIGNIEDAVCLKCHVPYDFASAKAWGSPDATHMLNAGVNHSSHNRPNLTAVLGYQGNLNTASFTSTSQKWIYLWR
ncbi:MAG: hypothetical protein FWD65_04060 [Coriobacteriia bacterium]|nr:hypothetical protein [Coriobacteriia bacterium]